MQNKDEKVTLTAVKEMGFSDRLIKELLPEPQLVTNPRYMYAAKMKLWNINDVKKAMENQAFKDYQKKREKRKLAAKKSVETKIAKLENETDLFIESLEIEHLELDKIRDLTIEAKQRWYDNHCKDCFTEPRSAYDADEETVTRWMVNYIRHNMTRYDAQLYNMKGKTGKQEIYFKLHDLILDKIAESYPELKEECGYQKLYVFL